MFNPLRDHDEKLADPGMDTEYHLQLVHTALQLQRNGELADPYQVGASSGTRHFLWLDGMEVMRTVMVL